MFIDPVILSDDQSPAALCFFFMIANILFGGISVRAHVGDHGRDYETVRNFTVSYVIGCKNTFCFHMESSWFNWCTPGVSSAPIFAAGIPGVHEYTEEEGTDGDKAGSDPILPDVQGRL